MYLNKYWRNGSLFLLYFLVSASYNLIYLYHFVDLNPFHSTCDGLENPSETGTLFGKYRLAAGPLWRSSWFSFPWPKFSHLPSHPTYYPLQTPNSDMGNNWGPLLLAGPGDRTRFMLPGLRCYTWTWKHIFSPVSTTAIFPFFEKEHINKRQILDLIGCQNIKMLLKSVGWLSLPKGEQRRKPEKKNASGGAFTGSELGYWTGHPCSSHFLTIGNHHTRRRQEKVLEVKENQQMLDLLFQIQELPNVSQK